jgi:uncharacterized protein (TIGR02147 family)
MPRRPPNISVFSYIDYRAYLRDWYQDQKKNRPGFSLRSFSKDAGFTSPNFYKMVMDGIRNLTEKSIIPFMRGLKLNQQERDFFRNLVFYTQAKTPEKKGALYERMLQSRKLSQIRPLERPHYDFFSSWHHPLVRELMTAPDFDGTPEYCAERIRPKITPAQAAHSMEILKILGFVVPGGDGRWVQSDALLTTGPELKSQAFMKYHQSLLEIAKEQLSLVPAEIRDVSSLTIGVAPEHIQALKEKIREFRKEVLKCIPTAEALPTEKPHEVYWLNIQFLPATQARIKTP